MRAVVDVLDAGRMAQPRRTGAGLEPLLAAHGYLMLKQQAQPLGVIERARFGVGGDLLVALGHAVQAERVEEIKGRMGKHEGLRQWK